MTVPQLRDAIRGAIDILQAEAAERRARRFRGERRVRCGATRDGTATLTAELAVEAAAAVWNALTGAARAAQAAGDPRSLDQLRADELVARATGTPRRPPSPDDDPELHDPDDACAAGRSNNASDDSEAAVGPERRQPGRRRERRQRGRRRERRQRGRRSPERRRCR
ncbi:MAG: hypothetical protein ACXV3S_09970 [Kineosporiaceae bacterium]